MTYVIIKGIFQAVHFASSSEDQMFLNATLHLAQVCRFLGILLKMTGQDVRRSDEDGCWDVFCPPGMMMTTTTTMRPSSRFSTHPVTQAAGAVVYFPSLGILAFFHFRDLRPCREVDGKSALIFVSHTQRAVSVA